MVPAGNVYLFGGLFRIAVRRGGHEVFGRFETGEGDSLKIIINLVIKVRVNVLFSQYRVAQI